MYSKLTTKRFILGTRCLQQAIPSGNKLPRSKLLIGFGLFTAAATAYWTNSTLNETSLPTTQDQEAIIGQKINWIQLQNFDTKSLYQLIENAAKEGKLDDIIALCHVAKSQGVDLSYYSVGYSVINAIENGHLDIAFTLLEQEAPRCGFLKNNLNYAVLTGDLKQIERLLHSTPYEYLLFTHEGYYMAPLHLACRLGYVDAVNLFLNHIGIERCSIMPNDYCGELLRNLFLNNRIKQNSRHDEMQIRVDHLACLNSLILYGIKINTTFYDGCTALDYAVNNNDIEAVTLLIKHGAKGIERYYLGFGTIGGNNDYYLSRLNSLEAIANIHAQEAYNRYYLKHTKSILVSIAKKNLNEMTNLLIKKGIIKHVDVALAFAALHGSSEVAQTLLKAGADKDQALIILGWSNLVWEVALQDVESLSRYLSDIAPYDYDSKHNIKLATEMAVKLNRPDHLKLLIKAGADVNHCDLYSRTLVYFSAEKGHEQCLEVLLDANATINVIANELEGFDEEALYTDFNADALSIAFKNDNYACVDLLLKNPNLTMDAMLADPYLFGSKSQPIIASRTIDSYQKYAKCYTKVNSRYKEILASNLDEQNFQRDGLRS